MRGGACYPEAMVTANKVALKADPLAGPLYLWADSVYSAQNAADEAREALVAVLVAAIGEPPGPFASWAVRQGSHLGDPNVIVLEGQGDRRPPHRPGQPGESGLREDYAYRPGPILNALLGLVAGEAFRKRKPRPYLPGPSVQEALLLSLGEFVSLTKRLQPSFALFRGGLRPFWEGVFQTILDSNGHWSWEVMVEGPDNEPPTDKARLIPRFAQGWGDNTRQNAQQNHAYLEALAVLNAFAKVWGEVKV